MHMDAGCSSVSVRCLMDVGRMTVQIYEPNPDRESIKPSVQRGEDEVGVIAIVISHGQGYVQVNMDEERGKWEIEVVGSSTIYHQ